MVKDTWVTDYDKIDALNAFIVCGVLYVVDYDTLMINYMYNTTSSEGKKVRYTHFLFVTLSMPFAISETRSNSLYQLIAW